MELPYVDGKYSIEYVVSPYAFALRGECLGYIFKNNETGAYLGEVKGSNEYHSLTLCVLSAPGVGVEVGKTVSNKKDLRPATLEDFYRFRCIPPQDFVLASAHQRKDTELDR